MLEPAMKRFVLIGAFLAGAGLPIVSYGALPVVEIESPPSGVSVISASEIDALQRDIPLTVPRGMVDERSES
jgi:hypothetical protein